MICESCGREVGPGDEVCVFCGARIDGQGQEQLDEPFLDVEKGKAALFFSSTLGKLTMGVLVVLVAGAISTGVFLTLRGNGGSVPADEESSDSATHEAQTENGGAAKVDERDLDLAISTMEQFLSTYVTAGWCSATDMMTPKCSTKFCSEGAWAPPPDQGDFDVISATVQGYAVESNDRIVFRVLQKDRFADGEETEYIQEIELKKSKEAWLINDVYPHQ